MRYLKNTVVALSLLAASSASAEVVYNETLVHIRTTAVEVDLNASTVLCSAADYSGLFLKILIPELAALTLLDHQNAGAGAPCVSAGQCEPGRRPENIINPYKPTEQVNITVEEWRGDEADTAAQTCETYLIERVRTNIRGFDFTHERQSSLGSRPFSDCVTSQAPVQPDQPAQPDEPADQPADDPGAADPQAGGCNTGGGVGGGMLALVLGALGGIGARRRRRGHKAA